MEGGGGGREEGLKHTKTSSTSNRRMWLPCAPVPRACGPSLIKSSLRSEAQVSLPSTASSSKRRDPLHSEEPLVQTSRRERAGEILTESACC